MKPSPRPSTTPARDAQANASIPFVAIVGEDENLTSIITAYLSHAGYQTQVFRNPGAFIASASAPRRPQVVVMDMLFSGGKNVATRVIAEYKAACALDIPVIALSASQDVEARLAALRAGAMRYLAKPLDFERLMSLIDDLTDYRVHAPYRVLLVDGDVNFLAFSAAILRDAGMIVQALPDPLKAFTAVQTFNPDVIVLDVHMPSISGLELAALLREEDAYAQLPILFLSAHANLREQLRALELDGDEFLLKPIDPGHLLAVVRARAKRSRHAKAVTRDLQKSVREQEFQAFALNQHAIVSVADAAGVITHVNDKFCEVSGYSPSELIGKNHRVVKSNVHPPAFYEEMWSTICAGKVWRGIICNRSKNGQMYWVESTIVPFLDENGLPYQYVSVRTDVTDIMEADAILRAERDLTDAAINALPGIFYLVSQEQRFIRVNENLARVSGYTAQEIESMTPLDFFDAHIHERITETIQQVFANGYAVMEANLVTRGGERIPYYFQAARVTLRNQACLIGTGTDITKLKEYDAALITAKEDAERANRAKSIFLSNMSHELRTPMNAIMGFAQLAETDLSLSTDQRDNIDEILKAGRHLLELINEVLDLAKIESGRIDLSIEPVMCGALIAECLSLIRPIADKQGVTLEWHPSGTSIVRADRVRLKQVLINLLSNAVKYNKSQGRVRIETHAIGATHLRLQVSDTGPGILTSRLKELFQPFQRLGAEQSKVEGTGIGLAISKRLIESMGGVIGAESKWGEGSTFWIELPLEPAAHDVSTKDAGAVGEENALRADLPSRTVLYIEDNPANLKLIAQMLARRPHLRLLTAHTPALGLDLALAERPDLVLLDIQMPGMDGYEALARLRAHEWGLQLPVIAITANAMPSDIARGLAAGFDEYLSKPVDFYKLMTTLDHFLASTPPHA